MFDLGAVYGAAIDVRDESGTLVNPVTATLTFTLPDGTTFSPSVDLSPDVDGELRYEYITQQAGRHLVRWVTTEPATGFTDAFDVAEAAPPTIISLADMKQTLGIDPSITENDDEIRAKLFGITKAIENVMNETIVRQSITSRDHVPHGKKLRLWKVPVVSLTSIATVSGSYSWDVSQLYVDDAGLVHKVTGYPVAGWVDTVYVAGYSVIPYNYIEGAKVLFQHEWETRRGPGGTSGVLGPEELSDYRQYSQFPRKVRDWLGSPRPAVA
jgi:hypothetical protein